MVRAHGSQEIARFLGDSLLVSLCCISVTKSCEDNHFGVWSCKLDKVFWSFGLFVSIFGFGVKRDKIFSVAELITNCSKKCHVVCVRG